MILLSTPVNTLLASEVSTIPIRVKNLTDEQFVVVTLHLPDGESVRYKWACPSNDEVTKKVALDAGVGTYVFESATTKLKVDVVTNFTKPTLSSKVVGATCYLSADNLGDASTWLLAISRDGSISMDTWGTSHIEITLDPNVQYSAYLIQPILKQVTNTVSFKSDVVATSSPVQALKVKVTPKFENAASAEYGSLVLLSLTVSNPHASQVEVYYTPKLPSWLDVPHKVELVSEPIAAKGKREFHYFVRCIPDGFNIETYTLELSNTEGYATCSGKLYPLEVDTTSIILEPKKRKAQVVPTNLSIYPYAANSGDTVTIALTVTNVGETPVGNVTLSQVPLPSNILGCICKFSGVPLAPGASYTYKTEGIAGEPGIAVVQVTDSMLTYEVAGNTYSATGSIATAVPITNLK